MTRTYHGCPHGPVANFDLAGAVSGFTASQQWLRDVPGYTDNLAGAPNENLVKPDKNNFGPRIGFAWQPSFSKDFVVRGGYGIYFTPEITNSWTVLTLNAPIVNTIDFTGANPLEPVPICVGYGHASSADRHLRRPRHRPRRVCPASPGPANPARLA